MNPCIVLQLHLHWRKIHPKKVTQFYINESALLKFKNSQLTSAYKCVYLIWLFIRPLDYLYKAI